MPACHLLLPFLKKKKLFPAKNAIPSCISLVDRAMHDWNTVKNSRRGKCWPASTMKGIKKLSIKTFSPATGDCYETVQKFHKCPKSHAYDIGTKIYERVWILSYYRVPKKNFILWKLAVANITADNEKFTIIFLENARDSFVDHIFIIWLGYILDNSKFISIQHQTWKTTRQFGTSLSHVPTHLLDVREGLGILLAKAHYGFLTASSNICHGQFSRQ